MNSKKTWKNSTKIILYLLIIIVLIVVVFTIYTYIEVNNTIKKTYEPINRIPSIVVPAKTDSEQEKTIRTYLILGIDRRPNTDDKGRTDVIMIATVNDHKKKITLTSIPRDSYVEIAGKGYKDKINHSYYYGVETTIATVENLTEIPIDNYVLFTFDSFVKTIDAIGGITVNVDNSIADYSVKELGEGKKLIEGEQLLSGKQALYFSRFRYDSKGDIGRNERQQQVIKGVLDQSKSFTTTSKIDEILEIIGDEIRTDLTFKDMVDLGLLMKNYSSEDFVKFTYNGHSERFGEQNFWYFLISEEERVRVSKLLKESLELDNGKINDVTEDLGTSPAELEAN